MPYPVPKEMTLENIKSVILEFRKAAENARLAGFDGIELDGADGFLIE